MDQKLMQTLYRISAKNWIFHLSVFLFLFRNCFIY